jgi:hypothetical protein
MRCESPELTTETASSTTFEPRSMPSFRTIPEIGKGDQMAQLQTLAVGGSAPNPWK